jgi:hypothetical protein
MPDFPPGPVAPKPSAPCPFCGLIGHNFVQCPRVKAIDFHPNASGTAWGSVARVEFLTPADNPLLQQPRAAAAPNWPTAR